MQKLIKTFLTKLRGKEKTGCCGVVVEEIYRQVDSMDPISEPQEKCNKETMDLHGR